jgi:malate synthase
MLLHSLSQTQCQFPQDSNSPTWRNQIEGQLNLYDAIRGQIHYVNPVTKQEYALKKETAGWHLFPLLFSNSNSIPPFPHFSVLKVRPRGWHLPEKHVLVNDKPMSASLFDFGLYLFHNAQTLQQKGSGPYFYLPKLENAQEAQLWADVFKFSEEKLGLAHGTIKCTVGQWGRGIGWPHSIDLSSPGAHRTFAGNFPSDFPTQINTNSH